MKAKKPLRQCCRYQYRILPNTTIKQVLARNPHLFNSAWKFWTYCLSLTNARVPDFDENPIVDDAYILFSSVWHEFDDWREIIDWDDYGTWYIYNFPQEVVKPGKALI